MRATPRATQRAFRIGLGIARVSRRIENWRAARSGFRFSSSTVQELQGHVDRPPRQLPESARWSGPQEDEGVYAQAVRALAGVEAQQGLPGPGFALAEWCQRRQLTLQFPPDDAPLLDLQGT